jgi:hypothetical protein
MAMRQLVRGAHGCCFPIVREAIFALAAIEIYHPNGPLVILNTPNQQGGKTTHEKLLGSHILVVKLPCIDGVTQFD